MQIYTIMRQHFFAGLLGISGAIIGCSSSVETSNASTGVGGSGGAAATTGVGGAAATTGVGGDTPGTTGSGGAPSECPPVTGFHVEIAKNNEPLYQDCPPAGGWEPIDFVVQGAVTHSTDSTFEVDACANIECKAPEAYQVSLANLGPSSGVPFMLPVGTYVELRFKLGNNVYQCAHALVVTNLPALHGAPNPTEAGSALWFQGQDGYPVNGTPVVSSGSYNHLCGDPSSLSFPVGGDMQVSAADDPAKKITLIQTGTLSTWSPGTAVLPGTYVVKNLTSLSTGFETVRINFVATRAWLK